jgi:hypothetical protein
MTTNPIIYSRWVLTQLPVASPSKTLNHHRLHNSIHWKHQLIKKYPTRRRRWGFRSDSRQNNTNDDGHDIIDMDATNDIELVTATAPTGRTAATKMMDATMSTNTAIVPLDHHDDNENLSPIDNDETEYRKLINEAQKPPPCYVWLISMLLTVLFYSVALFSIPLITFILSWVVVWKDDETNSTIHNNNETHLLDDAG